MWAVTLIIGLALGAYLAWALQRAFQRRVAEHLAARRPPAPSPEPADEEPPPLLDAAQLRLFSLAREMSRSPEVANPEDLPLVPAFAAMIDFVASDAFTDAQREAFVTGDRALPAWSSLFALARRPCDEPIAERALFWLNNFHPWTRALTLRLLHAWYPEDPELVGRVLVRLDYSWARESAIVVVLDRWLRLRAAVAALTFGSSAGELDDEDTRERVEAILQSADPALVSPLIGELKAGTRGAAADASSSRRPDAPSSTPAATNPQHAGRTHEPGSLAAPAVLPRAAFERARQRALRALIADPPRSVLISGEPGVGKSTLARALAAEMSSRNWRVFETSAIELNAGMSYVGQLEGRIQELLSGLTGEPKTLWLVRDFHQLMFAGRTTQNPTAVLDMLVPAIEDGRLLVIGETRPVAAEMLLGERPEFARLVEGVRLDAPRDEELRAIAGAWVALLPETRRGRVPAELIVEAVVLSRHHLGALGSPAGVLRLLQRALETAGDALEHADLTTEHLLAALSELTGLPASLLDERQSLDTSALREFFTRHVMGQPEAVRCLVERLALMKAGITSPSRPYAVFLFAGPSGTGKTELVKTLARYLFGSAERMVRVDMSELQNADAFDRLLAAGGIAAGGSLAARVRRQPFSVVLLDEFEKAHARVWDLFLQVFDDGRLTDSQGETVDFRNTFIVLTSNLGARMKSGERLGFVAGQDFNAREVERTVAATFRPEFLNRLDRIVVFQPLSRDAMRDILRKQIGEAFQRRGLRRRDWAVEIEGSALEFLLERGFTADLGARPLQRSLEQHLLVPLAKVLVEHRAPEGDQFLFVRADGDRLAVEFVDPDAPAAEPAEPVAGGAADVRAIAWDADGDAAEVATLGAAIEAIERQQAEGAWPARKAALLAEAAAPSFWQREDRFEVLGRAEYLDRVEAGVRSARSLLARLEGEGRQRAHHPRPLVRRLAQQLVLLDIAVREALEHGPRDAFVALEPGADPGPPAAAAAWRDRLVAMYEHWARARGMRLQHLDAPAAAGAAARARWLAISGFGALATLAPEDGLHVLEEGSIGAAAQRTTVRVRVAPQPALPARDAAELAAQAAAAFAAAGGAPHAVRRYREAPSPLVRDLVRHWRTGRAERIWAGDFDLVPGGGEDTGA